MTDTTTTSPNPIAADTGQSAVPSLDSIAAKMTAMKSETLRNQIRPTEQTATGQDDAAADSSPVTPNGVEVADSSDDEYAQINDIEGVDENYKIWHNQLISNCTNSKTSYSISNLIVLSYLGVI